MLGIPRSPSREREAARSVRRRRRPGTARSGHRNGVLIGDSIPPHRAAVGPRHARHREVVLDGDCDSSQRAGAGQGVTVDVHVGVQARVETSDCIEVGSHDLLAVEAAGRHAASDIGR